MQKSVKIPILIVGATGQLGALITKHSLKQPNLEVNILVRNPDKDKELVDQVQKAGGKVIKGDVTNPETLKDSTKGIHTVVSALIGDDNTVFEGQKAILDDALKNGVKRMVPSDFSLWAKKVEENEHPFLSQRLRFKKHLETTPIKGLHVWLGVFMETLFFFHSQLQPGLHYWENPDQKFDTTSYDDTARYVAAAVSNPDRVGDLRIHGDEVSINEFAAIYNKVTGKNVKPKNYGTIEDLKKKITELRSNGDFLRAALIAYEVPLFDGRGKMEAVDNAEFPEVKPLNLEEFIKANPKTAVLPESS